MTETKNKLSEIKKRVEFWGTPDEPGVDSAEMPIADYNWLIDQVSSLETKLQKAVEWIKLYGRHSKRCSFVEFETSCNCSVGELIKELESK